jgi:hypothetical protein
MEKISGGAAQARLKKPRARAMEIMKHGYRAPGELLPIDKCLPNEQFLYLNLRLKNQGRVSDFGIKSLYHH